MLSVILPAYNEEKNVGPLLADFLDFFTKIKTPFEIVVVNDGSKDGTANELGKFLGNSNISVVTHSENKGYGAALRSGFEKAKGDLIFFTDSDRQFNINELPTFLNKIGNYDFVVGFRKKRADSWLRIFYSQIFCFIVRVFFKVKARDIDCAFKLFKKNTIKSLPITSSGALINLEIFSLARMKDYKFLELPVQHFPRKSGRQTGGSGRVIFKALIDIFSLWKKVFKKELSETLSILGIGLSSIVATFLVGYCSYILLKDTYPSFFGIWNRWDTPSFLNIAQNGYQNVGPDRFLIVFFPLFPFAIRVFSLIFRSYLVSSLAVSNICYVISLFFLYKLAKKDFSRKVALRSIFFLSIFPTAYFFHAGYTESIFLMFACASFYYARKEKWFASSMLGIFASLTRINGVILLPALLIEYLQIKKFSLENIKKDILWLFTIPAGFLVYLFINYKLFGNALQFTVFMKENWFKSLSWPWKGFLSAIKSFVWRSPSSWVINGFFEVFFVIFVFLLVILFLKRLRPSYTFYAIVNLLIVTSTSFWVSIPRYVILIFPLYLALAFLCKRSIFYYFFTIFFLLLQGFFLSQFLWWHWAF